MLHSFTRNYNDLSTEAGFQFEFTCDCCGNGYQSSFIESTTYGKRKRSDTLGRGASALGGLLGGKFGDLGWAVERGSTIVRDRLDERSPEWRREQETAFVDAQREVKPHFRKCPACQKWVCRDCWNEQEGLCVECAPRESAYVAKARSAAMQRNIDEESQTATVWKGRLETRTTMCPQCGQPAGDGKFCNNCGAPLAMSKCAGCGASVAQGLKFCPECGAPMQKQTSAICPSCKFKNAPGTRFCGECGQKLN